MSGSPQRHERLHRGTQRGTSRLLSVYLCATSRVSVVNNAARSKRSDRSWLSKVIDHHQVAAALGNGGKQKPFPIRRKGEPRDAAWLGFPDINQGLDAAVGEGEK